MSKEDTGRRIHETFLWNQLERGLDLDRHSDVVDLMPLPPSMLRVPSMLETLSFQEVRRSADREGAARDEPPSRYLVRLHCRGLVRSAQGSIEESDDFLLGIQFSRAYTSSIRLGEPVTCLRPLTIWHPNIVGEIVCLGRVAPATSLVDLCLGMYELISWNKYRLDEPLNAAAAQWARQPENRARIPVDRRPVRRRRLDLQMTEQP